MTIPETIISIKKLLAELSKRIKDRESASFVQQIQTHQHTLEAAYLEAEHKALDHHREAIRLESENGELRRKMSDMENKHSNDVGSSGLEIRRLERGAGVHTGSRVCVFQFRT